MVAGSPCGDDHWADGALHPATRREFWTAHLSDGLTRETMSREKGVGESQSQSGILWDTPIQGRSELGPDRREETQG